MVKFLKKRMNLKFIYLLIIVAFLCTFLVGVMVYFIMEARYNNKPLWVEQGAYLQFPSMVYGEEVAKVGYFNGVFSAFESGERSLLQILLLGLFGNRLLSWPHAHLLIVLPSLFLFLVFWGKLIWERSASKLLAIGAILFFCSTPGFLSSEWGIGVGFSDYQSLFFISLATVFLIEGLVQRGLTFLRLFAFFVTLAVFSRITAFFYVAVICLPILLLYLAGECRRKSLKQVYVAIGNVLLLISPAILVIILQFNNLIWYYSGVNANQINQPIVASLKSIVILLTLFLGKNAILLLILIYTANLILILGKKLRLLSQDLAIYWWLFGFLGLLIFKGYTSDVPKEVMYAVPPLIVVSIAPISMLKKSNHLKTLVAIVLIVFSVWGMGLNFASNLSFASKSIGNDELIKKTQHEMAAILSDYSDKEIVWQSFTYPDWGIPVALVSYYELGKFTKPLTELFHNRQNYWEARYPYFNLNQVSQRIYGRMGECLDLAIILKDPTVKPDGMEESSFLIASALAKRVKLDNVNWSYYQDVNSEPFVSTLAIYVNNMERKYCPRVIEKLDND